LDFVAAYGSGKDVSVYSRLQIDPQRIYIVGKSSSKKQTTSCSCTLLLKGYSAHLEELNRPHVLTPAKFDAQVTKQFIFNHKKLKFLENFW